jgi:hypothetical protein
MAFPESYALAVQNFAREVADDVPARTSPTEALAIAEAAFNRFPFHLVPDPGYRDFFTRVYYFWFALYYYQQHCQP